MSVLLTSAFAADPAKPLREDLQTPPSISSADKSVNTTLDESFDTAVEIRQKQGDKIEPIKRGGRIVSIKVTPANGAAAYYLIDRLGNGRFALYDNTVDGVVVPSWVVMEW